MWMPVNLSGVLTDRYVYPFYCNVGYCDLYWIVVSMPQILFFFFFFFNDPPPPEFYPLPLHAPLPIPSLPTAKPPPPIAPCPLSAANTISNICSNCAPRRTR